MRANEKTRIDIDRLVIDSPVADREALVRAIRGELERLYAGGPPAAAGARSGGRLELADRSVESPAGAGSRDIGRQVARTIWNAARQAGPGEETR